MKGFPTARSSSKEENPLSPLRARLHEIIFEAETAVGKAFDVILLVAILLSVLAAMLETVTVVHERFRLVLYGIEWFFTILFTIEYVFRISCVRRPLRYATSFYGVVDLLAVLPTYLSKFITGTQSLLVIRVLRLLRIFRVFKLGRYLRASNMLWEALKASRPRIMVFLLTVFTLVIVVGTLMYLIEGPKNGFTSIPRGIYWAIVTMTTVGYGDIAPRTVPGQALAAIVMIMGYGIIAVPTGIFSVELVTAARQQERKVSTQVYPRCAKEGHDADAVHCKFCGSHM
jgi:voltage-gated potassium channel